MSMLSPSPQREIVERLAEEFISRYRRGEKPTLEEYAARYAEHADEILDLFPALVTLEQIAPHETGTIPTPSERTFGIPVGAPPERLGDFRILREVGRGGMGIVYEAEQISLRRQVALKVLPEQMLLSPKRRQRFEREARSAARLHHTNIVPVFGVGEESGLPYYVMQFIAGLGLDVVLDELRRVRYPGSGTAAEASGQGGLTASAVALSLFQKSTDRSGETEGGSRTTPAHSARVKVSSETTRDRGGDARRTDWSTYWRSVARIGLNVAEAVAYAHHEGVLHRDIKPGNLLLDDRGNVWITDFGLAKSDDQHDLTTTGEVVGTLRYVAPEVFEGKGDARSEVYALGLTLYEMLVLRPAFDEMDRGRLMQRIMARGPRRLDRIEAGIPRDLVTIVHKAIERDPASRYQTAAALAADLRAFLDDAPIQARRPWWPERLLRWARHHQGIAAALGVAAVLLLGATVASTLVAARFRVLAHESEMARVAAVRAQDEARRRKDAERWERYRANISNAASALQLQDIDAARRSLEQAPIEHRNWEWRHLESQLDWARAVLRGHQATIVALVSSSDGRKLASGSEDGWIRLWDLPSGRAIPTTKEHTSGIRALSFSPDGRSLLSAGYDMDMRLWDTTTGKVTQILKGHTGWIVAAVYSPDGCRIASASDDRTVRLWNAKTGKTAAVLRGHSAGASNVLFSNDGHQLASASSDATIRLWDAATGDLLSTLRGHGAAVRALAYSPDDNLLASGSGFPENSVRLWDVRARRPLADLRGHANELTSLAFSPDGARLASCSPDQTIRLWQVGVDRPIAVLTGHTQFVSQVVFSPDSRRLLSSSHDETIRLWDAADGRSIAVLRGHTRGVWTALFVAGGNLIASASGDQTVRLWDAELVANNGVLRGHSSYVYDVAFSPGGDRLASAGWDHTIRFWDLATARPSGQLDYDAKASGRSGAAPVESAYVASIAFSPDGRRLASIARDDRVCLWDVGTGRPIDAFEVPTNFWAVQPRAAFDSSGRFIATGGLDGSVRLWDTRSGELSASLSGHSGGASDVAFSPDGAILAAAGLDGTIRLWSAHSHTLLATLRGHASRVYRLAFNASGDRLASASEDRTARIWDLETKQTLNVLPHGSVVFGLAFSPDGSRLATGCADNTIRLWDVIAGVEVVELRGHTAYVHAVAFSPDGSRLASASGDFTVRIWDTLPPHVRAGLAR